VIKSRPLATLILGWLLVSLALPTVAMAKFAAQPGDGDGSELTIASSPRDPAGRLPGLGQRPLFGAYIPNAPQNLNVLTDFESLVGAPAEIIHWYQPWAATSGSGDEGTPLDRVALDRVATHGAIPMITWEASGAIHGLPPARLATITSGAFDDYIDEWARGLKAYARVVLLRPFHEMNNSAYPWAVGQSGNSAADLVRAWRYVHDRFSRLGVTNVRWVWCPNTENNQVTFAELYPGDQYVDWLAVDGYNGGSQLDWGGWLTPQQLFKRSYTSLASLNPDKPIMIAETSSVEHGGDRARWIEDLYDGLPADYPRISAIVWFQADTTNRGEADWRIQTSAASLDAFRRVISQ
jgi:Glycosyl hydrolase family 26